MKLTKSRLNEIIKEEVALSAIKEGDLGEPIHTLEGVYNALTDASSKVNEIVQGRAPRPGQEMSEFARDILVIIIRAQSAVGVNLPDPPPEGP